MYQQITVFYMGRREKVGVIHTGFAREFAIQSRSIEEA
jgi:hypothetical protein